jgi:hypothetical protein
MMTTARVSLRAGLLTGSDSLFQSAWLGRAGGSHGFLYVYSFMYFPGS